MEQVFRAARGSSCKLRIIARRPQRARRAIHLRCLGEARRVKADTLLSRVSTRPCPADHAPCTNQRTDRTVHRGTRVLIHTIEERRFYNDSAAYSMQMTRFHLARGLIRCRLSGFHNWQMPCITTPRIFEGRPERKDSYERS